LCSRARYTDLGIPGLSIPGLSVHHEGIGWRSPTSACWRGRAAGIRPANCAGQICSSEHRMAGSLCKSRAGSPPPQQTQTLGLQRYLYLSSYRSRRVQACVGTVDSAWGTGVVCLCLLLTDGTPAQVNCRTHSSSKPGAPRPWTTCCSCGALATPVRLACRS
jgi:hypothetical protein